MKKLPKLVKCPNCGRLVRTYAGVVIGAHDDGPRGRCRGSFTTPKK